jgi:SAM-dependent methyltransferase
MTDYLMAGQPSELERLQLQARVWEPAGRRLLGELGSGAGLRVLDVGCGSLGWLRILSNWVGPAGEVVGADIDERLLDAARSFVAEHGLSNVHLVPDDLFASALNPGSFALVHSRFQICPLGRAEEQLATYLRLCRPGGWLVLEDPDSASWRYNPPAPAAARLIDLIGNAFAAAGGDLDAGRWEFDLLRTAGLDPRVRAEVVALPPGHPYLRLPLQFAVSLEARLRALAGDEQFTALRAEVEEELADPGRWGTSITLVQTWASTT